MSIYSRSFLQPSFSNISLDVSGVLNQEPLSYNSYSSIDKHEFEVEMIRDKYQKEYTSFFFFNKSAFFLSHFDYFSFLLK